MVNLIKDRERELRALCERYHVARLDLFGSAANGNFNNESDLDFVVTFKEMPPEQFGREFWELLFALEDLFGRKVDLVVESTIRNPYFREELESTRKLLYAA